MTFDIFTKSKIQYMLTKLKLNLVERSDLVTLSQAEYNALTTAKKNDPNKYYFIYDATDGLIIKDDEITEYTVWSSKKTKDELDLKADLPEVEQFSYTLNTLGTGLGLPTITFRGYKKGDLVYAEFSGKLATEYSNYSTDAYSTVDIPDKYLPIHRASAYAFTELQGYLFYINSQTKRIWFYNPGDNKNANGLLKDLSLNAAVTYLSKASV